MALILALAIAIWILCAVIIAMCITLLVDLRRSGQRRRLMHDRWRTALRQAEADLIRLS